MQVTTNLARRSFRRSMKIKMMNMVVAACD
jgi:hypothetical protein